MKVLADTSVWISHLHEAKPELATLLEANEVLIHDSVVGELSCGNLKNRQTILFDLKCLPKAAEANFNEVIKLIETHKLYGKGLSWIDCNLLASAIISGAKLFTDDHSLGSVAEKLKMRY